MEEFKKWIFWPKINEKSKIEILIITVFVKIYTESKNDILDQDNRAKSGYFQACGLLRKWLFLKLGVINPRALK